MNHDFISVDFCEIVGVNQPLLIAEGLITLKENYQFKVLVDGKEKHYECMPRLGMNGYHLEVELEKHEKNIEISVIYNEEEFLFCKRKNSMWIRAKTKLRKSGFYQIPMRFLRIVKRLVVSILKAVRILWKEHHFLVPLPLWKKYFKDLKEKMRFIRYGDDEWNPMSKKNYNDWINAYEKEEEVSEKFVYQPLISVVIPIYNISREYLSECLDSILNQSYQNFEICLADDCSTCQETLDTLKEYEEKDQRIKVIYRETNGHISAATNSAISLAAGEFIALMDNDDVLTPNALYENVKVLNQDQTIDLIYSDEDKLDMDGLRRDPNFKPDFSFDTFLSSNYLCHFTVLRKSIVDEIGGYRLGYEGAQDYDLFIRFIEKTDRIHHLDKTLYRWRMIPGSTAATIDSKGYAVERGRQSLQDAMDRRNIKAEAKVHSVIPMYYIDYQLEVEPSVSIIIPTRDLSDTLEVCLNSIYKKNAYKNFEVVIVDNNSEQDKTFALFEKYKKEHENFKVVEAKMEFNYSKINNLAIQTCDSEYVVLLNNDTEILTEDWLRILVSYAAQDHVGAVGAKLLYPDMTVQHAGVIAGVGGVASHYGLGHARNDIGIYGRLCVPYNYSAVTAACLAIKKSKYDEVGGLNEDLEVSYNDIEFCFKLLDKGYYNVCVPQVELIHYESKSRGLPTTGNKYKQFMNEQKYMYDKWGKYIENDPFYNKNYSKKRAFMLNKELEY